jgi:plasmid stabilization system protein ParE
MRHLSTHPHSGRPGLIPGTRILVRGDYLISYRITFERDGTTPRSVEIFAVRHARQADAREPH